MSIPYNNHSIISQETSLKGELHFCSETIIYGSIDGIINIEGEYKVTLGKDAKITGDLHCHDIEVLGEIEGSIFSRGKVTIRSSGKVTGKLKSSSLVVYPGAKLNLEAHAESSL